MTDLSPSILPLDAAPVSIDQASMFLSVIYLLKQNIKVDEMVNIFSLVNLHIF
jgi:hypothetical protein